MTLQKRIDITDFPSKFTHKKVVQANIIDVALNLSS